MPVRIALIGISNRQNARFSEWPPLNLKTNWQAIGIKPARHAHRRQAKIVDGLVLIDTS